MANAPAVRARVAAGIGSILLVAATLSPVLREPHEDDFPLSTFPMFAMRRSTKLTLSYAVAYTYTGERRSLGPEYLGTQEVLQARVQIDTAVRGGWKQAAELCREITHRMEVLLIKESADLFEVVILTGTHDAVEYLLHGTLGAETVRARCAKGA